MIEAGKHRAVMDGREVFKSAAVLMPQAVGSRPHATRRHARRREAPGPHQANLRIIEMVQKTLGLRDDQVYANIQKYGNTTAASIPIALDEALSGRATAARRPADSHRIRLGVHLGERGHTLVT